MKSNDMITDKNKNFTRMNRKLISPIILMFSMRDIFLINDRIRIDFVRYIKTTLYFSEHVESVSRDNVEYLYTYKSLKELSSPLSLENIVL